MNEEFDNINATSRVSPILVQRMNAVAGFMYKEFLEYSHSNVNTLEIFVKMVSDMQLTVEDLKRSFSSRGIPTENIYYEYDKERHIAFLKYLWHSITFFSDLKGNPKVVSREKDAPMLSGRIIAAKGRFPELSQGYNEEIEQKLLDNEIGSVFVPADKNAKALIKIRRRGELPINQMEAPREFLLKVIETLCTDRNYHKESSLVTLSI